MRTIRNCKVAVIGGAGFLGSHLSNHLVEDRGCDVLIIDNLSVGRREFVHRKARFEHHDITKSEERLRHILQGCQFVFNYAAMPYIPVSFARPCHVFELNAMAALYVINAAQDAGCEGILQVSSAEIYGGATVSGEHDLKPRRISEDAQVIPHSSYGAAKAAIDAMVQVRWREAKTPCIALRQFNCVGERETHPYIVPEIIGQLANQETHVECETCGGTGERNGICSRCDGKGEYYATSLKSTVKLGNNSFRDFLYAGDAVRIAVELLERGQFGEVYNLGSETGIKMYDLAKLIGKIMGFADVRVERDESRVRPWEIWHLQSDNTKIARAVGVQSQPLLTLEEALRRTVAWYESNGRKWAWER